MGRFMNRACALFVMLLAMTLAQGCDFLADDDDKSFTGAGSHTYFPMKTGATWTYGPLDENAEYYAPYTETVTGTVEYQGKTYWRTERVMERDISMVDRSYVRVEGDIVYTPTGPFLHKPADGGIDGYIPGCCPPEFAEANLGISSGASWVSFGSSDMPGAIRGGQETITCIGAETVTVPAGQFEGCLKMRTVCSIYEIIDNVPGPSEEVNPRTRWYAPNVGLVKELHESNGATYVLTSWSIP